MEKTWRNNPSSNLDRFMDHLIVKMNENRIDVIDRPVSRRGELSLLQMNEIYDRGVIIKKNY